jgi:ferrous iron transport protein A
MPLSLAQTGVVNSIKKVGGKDELKKHLQTLGFVEGGNVSVVSQMGGSVIVNVKDARIAISREMANKIII